VRSDLFSVGCTLYEMVTGEKAFPGESATSVMYKIVHEAPALPRALRPGIDPALEEVVLKALANDPDDRFQNCSDLVAALQDCLLKPVFASAGAGAGTALQAPIQESVSASTAEAHSEGKPTGGVFTSEPRILTWRSVTILIGTLGLGIIICLVVLMPRSGPPKVILLSTAPIARTPIATPPVEPAQIPPAITYDPQTKVHASGKGQVRTTATSVTPPAAGVGNLASGSESVPRGHLSRQPEGPSSPVSIGTQAPVSQPPSPAKDAPNQSDGFSALLVRGDQAFQQNQYATALSMYENAYHQRPSNTAVRRKLAVVLTLLGRPEEAQKFR
jgi:serine/threonine protein kinase